MSVAIALLASELPAAAPDAFRLLPAGLFRAQDGRPEGLPGWVLTPEDAARLVQEAEARATDYPIDYEHQILEAKKNGQPAPAAGWFKKLEARADGLWAVGVRWTERARQMIEAGEYRYVSPVFTYDKKSGRVTRLLMAAITNHPALDGLTDLSPLTFHLEDDPMPDHATTAAAAAHKAADAASVPAGAAPAPASAPDALKAKDAEIARLTQELSELKAKAIPMSEHAKLQGELAALKAEVEADKKARLIEAGLSDGRILPAQKDYWAAQPLAALSAWLKVAQPVAALTSAQSQGVAPNAGKKPLTEEQALLCRIGGWDEEVFRGDA